MNWWKQPHLTPVLLISPFLFQFSSPEEGLQKPLEGFREGARSLVVPVSRRHVAIAASTQILSMNRRKAWGRLKGFSTDGREGVALEEVTADILPRDWGGAGERDFMAVKDQHGGTLSNRDILRKGLPEPDDCLEVTELKFL